MAGLPSNDLQRALYQRLSAAVAPYEVYDSVPENGRYPYVLIGADTLINADDKTTLRHEYTVTIHVWDNTKAGRKSVKGILSSIYEALHRQEEALPISSAYRVVRLLHEFEETLIDPTVEGEKEKYFHGVHRYRVVIETV